LNLAKIRGLMVEKVEHDVGSKLEEILARSHGK